MSTVLLAWIGQTDFDCANGSRPGPGPIAAAAAARSFDALVLLSNYAPERNRAYLDRLAEWHAPAVHLPNPSLIRAVEIENFKGIGRPMRVELRPVTLLFGANSAGKSTVLRRSATRTRS